MSTVPKVELNSNGVLEGWSEFERWALLNVPEWREARRVWGEGNLDPQEGYMLIAHLMTARAVRAEDDLIRRIKSGGAVLPVIENSPLREKAQRVVELYRSQYLVGHGDGGRVAHAMKALAEALL